MAWNAALTEVALDSVTLQVASVPVQPEVQPVKRCFAAAWAVSLTWVPIGSDSLQSPGQLMPDGADSTLPLPSTLTLMAAMPDGVGVKLAVTLCALLIVTLQLPLPVQPAPLQPLKVKPLFGVAVSVTLLPCAKLLLQVVPQLMPAGDELTLPEPLRITFSAKFAVGTAVKVAVTERALPICTWQVLPVQARPLPLQPLKA
jgi:hypothetical protein